VHARACSKCETVLRPTARYCARCGSAAVAVMGARLEFPPLSPGETWRRLSNGWTRLDVRRVLGQPLAIAFPTPHDSDAPALEEWTYRYTHPNGTAPEIRGVVAFLTTDGQVHSWLSPNWVAWGE